jgi:hypothetical protein
VRCPRPRRCPRAWTSAMSRRPAARSNNRSRTAQRANDSSWHVAPVRTQRRPNAPTNAGSATCQVRSRTRSE